jgi:hypothetical protein
VGARGHAGSLGRTDQRAPPLPDAADWPNTVPRYRRLVGPPPHAHQNNQADGVLSLGGALGSSGTGEGSAVLVEPAERQQLPLWRWVEHDIQSRHRRLQLDLPPAPFPYRMRPRHANDDLPTENTSSVCAPGEDLHPRQVAPSRSVQSPQHPHGSATRRGGGGALAEAERRLQAMETRLQAIELRLLQQGEQEETPGLAVIDPGQQSKVVAEEIENPDTDLVTESSETSIEETEEEMVRRLTAEMEAEEESEKAKLAETLAFLDSHSPHTSVRELSAGIKDERADAQPHEDSGFVSESSETSIAETEEEMVRRLTAEMEAEEESEKAKLAETLAFLDSHSPHTSVRELSAGFKDERADAQPHEDSGFVSESSETSIAETEEEMVRRLTAEMEAEEESEKAKLAETLAFLDSHSPHTSVRELSSPACSPSPSPSPSPLCVVGKLSMVRADTAQDGGVDGAAQSPARATEQDESRGGDGTGRTTEQDESRGGDGGTARATEQDESCGGGDGIGRATEQDESCGGGDGIGRHRLSQARGGVSFRPTGLGAAIARRREEVAARMAGHSTATSEGSS